MQTRCETLRAHVVSGGTFRRSAGSGAKGFVLPLPRFYLQNWLSATASKIPEFDAVPVFVLRARFA